MERLTLLATDIFTNQAGGSWDIAANWSRKAVPANGDDVTIPALTGNAAVTLAASASGRMLNSLTLNGILMMGGSLTVTDGIVGGGTLNLSGTLSSTTVGRRVTIEGNYGILDSDTVNGNLIVSNDNYENPTYVKIRGGLVINGSITLGTDFGELLFVGSQTLSGSGSVVIQAPEGYQDYIDVYSTANYPGSTLTIGENVSVDVSTGSVVTIGGRADGLGTTGSPAKFINKGAILLYGDDIYSEIYVSSLLNDSTGRIVLHNATISSNQSFVNSGKITLDTWSTITGNSFTQTPTGVLAVEFGAPNPTSYAVQPLYPLINVNNVTVAGSLNMVQATGSPSLMGQTFTLIEGTGYNGLVGTYNSVNGGSVVYKRGLGDVNVTLTAPVQIQVPYTPLQIRTAYGINALSATLDGSGQTIAIIVAYNDSSIYKDVNNFDSAFNATAFSRSLFTLYGPASKFLTVLDQDGDVVNPANSTIPDDPNPNNTWEFEESMDVEWAHVIAPGAHIVVIECVPQNISTKIAIGVSLANNLAKGTISIPGVPPVTVVSMSWGSIEGTGPNAYTPIREDRFDAYFDTPGVTYLASSGDYGASQPHYPAFSPNVIAVGGTEFQTLDANGDYPTVGPNGEIGWSDSGGGISLNESTPDYQKGVQGNQYTKRTIPDVAFNATNISIYDSFNLANGVSPWNAIGSGTSFGVPCWAGLIAIVDQGLAMAGHLPLSGRSQTLPALYAVSNSNFHDIQLGADGPNNRFDAEAGYDLVTGLGTPIVNRLVPAMIAWILAHASTQASSVKSGIDDPNVAQPFSEVTTFSRPDLTASIGSLVIAYLGLPTGIPIANTADYAQSGNTYSNYFVFGVAIDTEIARQTISVGNLLVKFKYLILLIDQS